MAATTGPGPMKRMALELLVGVALLYALATWQEARGGHAGWGWLAAFAEAAMVGAIADWFAVVALFRHPLGLPIPHTAILPRSKARLGANLARFFCDNFLGTVQVLAKLRAFDAAGRLAAWLSRPAQAERLGRLGVAAAGQVLEAVDDQRLRDFLGRAAAAGLRQLDFSRTAGQVLETLTAEGRHQAMLDAVLGHAAQWLDDEALQDQLTESIAQEVKALRYVGLDQVAARLATRKLVASIARALGETAADPAHPLRQRFDAYMHGFVQRLQQDPAFVARGERLRDELLAHNGLRDYLDGLWQQLREWLQADLARPDSAIGQRIARLAASLGERLASDAGMRAWLNEQLEQAAPAAIERWREDIRRYIEQRVADWDTDELVAELEQHVGRDLQFIRINGTVVGGLVGVAIHAITLAVT